MTKTVTISALRADSTPYAHHDVIVTLVAGSAGGVVGSNVIVSQTKVPLDADGEGSIVLATNDVEITSPTTSFYRFTVEGSSPTITRSIRVTDALPSTISWTRSGIEVGDPTTPDRDVAAEYVRMANGQSLPNYLDDLPSGGGGADHTVAAFADDFAADGSFTTVPLLPGGDIPRAFLTGATVLVVTGDNLGLWTIPASGPATAGTALAPGDVIASQSGRMAVAQTADGTTLSGVRLQADVPYVSTIETALAGDIDTVGNGLAAEITNRGTAVTNEANARIAGDAALAVANTASLTRQRMAEQAERVDAPTKWAVCGTAGSVWEADFQIPGATSTLAIETLVRIVGPAREPGFVEVIAESLDGAGAWDRYETALWLQDVNTDDVIEAAVSFAEGTAVGDSVEWQLVPGGQQDYGATAPTAIGPWVRYLWVYDFTAHTITTYYEDDVFYDHEFHGKRWATIGAYTNPGIDSLHATADEATWIGRGVAEYHQGHTHVWVDGTEVLLFDPSTAAIGAASIFDSVAVDGSDDPIEWVGTDSVVGGVASGAVASVNGETGTVVLDATDVGALPDTTVLPWHDDYTIAHSVVEPTTLSGTTQTFVAGSYRGGGYATSGNASGWSWTFARLPLRAGTYTRRYLARTDANSGIVTFTLSGGISAGTADGYSASAANDVVNDATGIVIPADGFYDLTMTSTTKNASSAAWRANAQVTRLFRTGA